MLNYLKSELFLIQRLHHGHIKSGIFSLVLYFLVNISRACNQIWPIIIFFFDVKQLNFVLVKRYCIFTKCESVHHWHIQVTNYKVVLFFFNFIESFKTIEGLVDILYVFLLYHHFLNLKDKKIVVYQQNFQTLLCSCKILLQILVFCINFYKEK